MNHAIRKCSRCGMPFSDTYQGDVCPPGWCGAEEKCETAKKWFADPPTKHQDMQVQVLAPEILEENRP